VASRPLKSTLAFTLAPAALLTALNVTLPLFVKRTATGFVATSAAFVATATANAEPLEELLGKLL
ncbi:hypothetical protein, partial [Streptococcus pneumoniae]|uniref:hypothetical protein n=1 Tax=Streptococcus pneumoniae TaxID=1313 RepID=UPI0018B0F2D0